MGKCARFPSCCAIILVSSCRGSASSCRFSRLTTLPAKGRRGFIFMTRWGRNSKSTEYAATGSGSPAVRGVLFYENRWGKKPLHKLSEQDAVTVALRALDTAAEADTATGGVDRNARIFPIIKIISRDGIKTLPDRADCGPFQEHRGMIEEPYRWVEAIANRREYIETQLAPGSPIAALSFRDGILFVTVGRARQKLFEIYDRIAMGAIGHPGDIERLRMAAIELASTEGFTRSAADVSLRRLAFYSLSPLLKTAFEQVYGAPYLARMIFAEVGTTPADDLFLRVEYDGAIVAERLGGGCEATGFSAISGTARGTELMEELLRRDHDSNCTLKAALKSCARCLECG